MGSQHSSCWHLTNNTNSTNNHNNHTSIEQNITKYKNILKCTWNKLLENKLKVGLSIYESIVFGSTSRRNGRAKSTVLMFENTNLNLQSARFMDMLHIVINKLDETEELIETLKHLSVTHIRSYNVLKTHYLDFKNGFMKAIKIELASTWTITCNNAWEWFWNLMIDIMCPDHDECDDDYNYNKHQIITDNICKSKSQQIIDINDYFIELFALLCDNLKTSGIPHEIIEIITLFSLDLTSYCCGDKRVEITSCAITGNINCIATRIKNSNSNNVYSVCCGTIMSKYWISDKGAPLNKYMHKIDVILESQTRNNINTMDSCHVCIGFSSDVINDDDIDGIHKNAFGDLQCGFAVRCWDKRLVHNGIIHSKYTLQTSESRINGKNDENGEIQRILNRRLHEGMKVNDKLTFLVDMQKGNECIEILLNDVHQNNDELKFVLKNIEKLAFCISLWTVGIKVRISSWTLIESKQHKE